MDASKIEPNCPNFRGGIELYPLKIITNGQSWYNSLGYFSENFENEQNYNYNVTNSIFNNIVTERNLLQKSNKLFPTINTTLTVKEYFNRIMNYLNQRFDDNDVDACEKYTFIQSVIQNIRENLLYDPRLTKYINKAGGRKKQQLKQSRRRIRTPMRNGKRKSRKLT